MPFVIQTAAKTDVGLVRTNNEDNFGYDSRHGIFVVCDGMGGQAAGELASKIAVDTVLNHFSRDPHESQAQVVGRRFGEVSERANKLANAIQFANHAIHIAAQNPDRTGMGCTIVAVYVHGSQFSIANVGDSRIYLVRGNAIQQLTSDHSLVMEQVRRGIITMEQLEHSKMQNVILKALGSEESVEPDLADHEFSAGDVLLLCSDGLSRYVKESAMVEVIKSGCDLEQACDELIGLAKTGGSDDNITCMLLRAEQPRRGRLMDWFTAGSGG
jgi:serine/threonine protein phosphatase PrpC